MLKLLLVFLGGGVGSLLRYAASGGVQALTNAKFPAGTLAVNVLGCFLIGVLASPMLTGQVLVKPEYRAAILIGVLGGFTTFSTFSIETLNLAKDGQFGLALLNVGASVVLCLAAAWLGLRVASAIFGA